ncbi:MAG TPA: hypothetical protein PLN69_01830 [bacterium]|nr:hypothetical protein [bacterium]
MSPTAVGLILFSIFFIFAALMYTGKLPALLALPLMAAALYLVGGAFYHGVSPHAPGWNIGILLAEFVRVVIEEGMPRMWHYVITVLLGAILAELLKESGVSRTIIRWASELGGDHKIVMCILLTAATAVLFVSLTGLGSVIMVASIVIPILLGIGVPPPVAGSLFLFGMSLGGAFNPVNWGFFVEFMTKSGGMERAAAQQQLLGFVVPFAGIFILVTVVFVLLNARRGFSSFWAIPQSGSTPEKQQDAGPLALLSPIIPILLVIGFNLISRIKGGQGYIFPINTALLIGVLYCLAVSGRGANGRIQRLTKAIFEGISGTAPVAALIIGIGMIIRVVWDPAVGTYMEPVLKQIIPSGPILYVIVFTLLAPLALYRGPLNVWGMGSALAAVMIGTGVLPPVAIMGALYSVGMIQGVSDPTNTHNAWIAGFLGEDVQVFTRKTLPYTWILAAIGLALSAFMFLR